MMQKVAQYSRTEVHYIMSHVSNVIMSKKSAEN